MTLCSQYSRALTFENLCQLARPVLRENSLQAHILKSQHTVALYSTYARALTSKNFVIYLHRSTAERESATRPLICLLKIQNGASVRRGEGWQLLRLMSERDDQLAAPVSGL